MLRTIENDKILNCEIEYARGFCESFETQDFVRFRDNLLMDMYYHNFTLVKKSASENELFQCIKSEIQLRREEGQDFCNIVSFVPINECLIGKFEIKPQISKGGFYIFDIDKLSELNNKKKCRISKVTDLGMVEDLLKLDLEQDGSSLGVDFCTRRLNRRKDNYLQTKGVNAYICYDNNEAIGNCDLFINKDIAKIEDFAVSRSKQRQGYGTVILKSLIETALNSGAKTIYLETDEEDTAKEMYLKSGFHKVGEKTDLFFKL